MNQTIKRLRPNGDHLNVESLGAMTSNQPNAFHKIVYSTKNKINYYTLFLQTNMKIMHFCLKLDKNLIVNCNKSKKRFGSHIQMKSIQVE